MRAPILVAVAALLIASGCGTSPKATILTLDMVPPQAPQTGYRGPPIAVPAVHMPAAIDRAEFVRQTAPGELEIDDFARWSAPLGVLARDALVRDLTQRLPVGAVLPPGAAGGSGRTLVYDVTILSLDSSAAGGSMQAAFRRLPQGMARIVTYSASEGATPPVAATAVSTMLGKLADDIAADAAAGAARP